MGIDVFGFLQVVRQHNSKFRANCILFDTTMRFGTLMVDTKTNIFRYSADFHGSHNLLIFMRFLFVFKR